MDFDSPDNGRTASGSGSGPGRGWGTYGLVLAVASALVIGGVIGVRWGQHRETSQRQAEASTTLSLTSAVVPAATPQPPVQDIATVVQKLDIALVNTGPALVSDVAVKWDAVHQAYSTGAEGKVTLSNLTPGEAQRVTLTLRQPCTAPALPGVGPGARLRVSARTPDGRSRQATLQPLGLDSTWAAMKAACPVNDTATETTTVHVIATATGRDAQCAADSQLRQPCGSRRARHRDQHHPGRHHVSGPDPEVAAGVPALLGAGEGPPGRHQLQESCPGQHAGAGVVRRGQRRCPGGAPTHECREPEHLRGRSDPGLRRLRQALNQPAPRLV